MDQYHDHKQVSLHPQSNRQYPQTRVRVLIPDIRLSNPILAIHLGSPFLPQSGVKLTQLIGVLFFMEVCGGALGSGGIGRPATVESPGETSEEGMKEEVRREKCRIWPEESPTRRWGDRRNDWLLGEVHCQQSKRTGREL